MHKTRSGPSATTEYRHPATVTARTFVWYPGEKQQFHRPSPPSPRVVGGTQLLSCGAIRPCARAAAGVLHSREAAHSYLKLLSSSHGCRRREYSLHPDLCGAWFRAVRPRAHGVANAGRFLQVSVDTVAGIHARGLRNTRESSGQYTRQSLTFIRLIARTQHVGHSFRASTLPNFSSDPSLRHRAGAAHDPRPGLLLHHTILLLLLLLLLYYTILYYTILYYTILYYTYYTTPYYTILYYTILFYTILYYTMLYYTILYYTILYYTRPSSTAASSATRAS